MLIHLTCIRNYSCTCISTLYTHIYHRFVLKIDLKFFGITKNLNSNSYLLIYFVISLQSRQFSSIERIWRQEPVPESSSVAGSGRHLNGSQTCLIEEIIWARFANKLNVQWLWFSGGGCRNLASGWVDIC